MSMLERLRAWIWRVEEKSNELEYSVLDEVHKAEDALDDATGGRFYDAAERVDEESSELLEKIHFDDDGGQGADEAPRER